MLALESLMRTHTATLPIFTAEVTAILYARQPISSDEFRNFCLNTDNECFATTTIILLFLSPGQIMVQLSSLSGRGSDIVFCWVPSHVGIKGNELVGRAAKSPTIPFMFPFATCLGKSSVITKESGKKFATQKLTIICIPFLKKD
ncbi:hypothetical protein AVEN_205659-1 [Araneus ventricosus]|uniref:RNase H type-1 domain-containing protein n=1 Tax=Araneus ventricosus TaxID=182803 RepID=A0A4Y2PPC7_ARAVE|nr:hypothetical protein AVEN_205659-1 [Araneus ventricosus]